MYTDTPTHRLRTVMRERVDAAIAGRALVPLSVLADLLGIETRALYQQIYHGRVSIDTVQLGGKTTTVRIPADEVYRVLGLDTVATDLAPQWLTDWTEQELIAWWRMRPVIDNDHTPTEQDIEQLLVAGFRMRKAVRS